MSTLADLKVLFDVPEPRVLRGRLNVSCDGTAWSTNKGDGNVWIDPITRTAFLMPAPVSALWNSDGTGVRTRLRKSDYQLATPDDWMEVPRLFAEDYYLEKGNGAKATTATSWAANQPFYLSCYVPGVEGLHEQTVLIFGWGTEGAAGSVSCRLRANGSVIVYKSGNQVGIYSVSGGSQNPLKGKGGGANALAQSTINLLLIPCRRRELLVVTSWGDGFSHVFSDLTFADGNTIVPSGAFWWQVPGGYGSVQCAAVKFAPTGTLYGPLTTLRYPPVSGQSFTPLPAYDPVGPGSSASVAIALEDENGNPFMPDSVRDKVRLKVTLSGTTINTVGLYAVDHFTGIDTTSTAAFAVEVTQLLDSLSIAVPEHGAATISIAGYDPGTWYDTGVQFVDVTSDRPFAVKVGTFDIMRGTLGSPSVQYGQGKADGLGDLLTWEGGDRWGDLALEQFTYTLPFDGLPLTTTETDLVMASGVPASAVDVYDDGFLLPYTPAVSQGQWELLPERGDTPAQWIDKLSTDFSANWLRGWGPSATGYKYIAYPPSQLPSTPQTHLYHSFEDAQAANVPYESIPSQLVRTWRLDKKAPEANQVIVIGQDPQTRRFIYSQYNDVESQLPSTPPVNRPVNWRGRTVPVQIIEPAITTQAAADRARDVLIQRLTTLRIFATWDSDFLIKPGDKRPLWKTDVVRVHNPGRTGWADWRIIAIPRIDLVRVWEHGTANAKFSANCQYAAERIVTGTGTGL